MSDQVDTLREHSLDHQFRRAMMALRLEVDGSIVDSITEIVETYCQGVAKEARLDELKRLNLYYLQHDGEGEHHLAAQFDVRIAELTGNKPGHHTYDPQRYTKHGDINDVGLLASSETPTALSNEADNRCGVCGDGGHTAFDCPNTSDPSEVA